MKKKFAAITIVFLACFAASAEAMMVLSSLYDADWEASFTLELDNGSKAYRDFFIGGAGPPPATDGYEIQADLVKAGLPDSAKFVQMKTIAVKRGDPVI